MKIESIGRPAFDAIYEGTADRVYRLAYRYTKNSHTAEEITQSVFLKLYQYMDRIDMTAAPRWLFVTARNMSLNHNEKLKPEILFDDGVEEELMFQTVLSSENEFFQKYKQKGYSGLAEDILGELYITNERWYEAITITYCLGKPQKEVAEIMDIPLETLHSILHRAKQWIKKNYHEQYRCLHKA